MSKSSPAYRFQSSQIHTRPMDPRNTSDDDFQDLMSRYLSRTWEKADDRAVTYLTDFLDINNHCAGRMRGQCKATFDITTQFDSVPSTARTVFTHRDLERYLLELRTSSIDGRISLRTLVAENICPHSICQLGINLDIRPLFWATHFEKTYHTQDEDVDAYLPPVLSGSRDFLNVQYFEPRELESHSEPLESMDTIEMVHRPLESFQNCGTSSASTKDYTSDVKREVQVLPQRSKDRGPSLRVAMIPGPLSVWTTQEAFRTTTDVMVVLIDPMAPRLAPKANFHLDMNRIGHILKPRERMTRYLMLEKSKETDARSSGELNLPIRARARSAVRRLISDQWRLTQGYVARDMDLIQQKTEDDFPDFQVARKLLKDLFFHRQKCQQYSGQIKETIDELKKWDTDRVDCDQDTPVSRDLEFARRGFVDMSVKTEAQLHLLTALTSVREAQQGLEESHGVTRLTRIATIYLPFSTMAAVLAMPDKYAPGKDMFWVYWVASTILAVLVITALVNYERVLVPLTGVGARLRARVRTAEKRTDSGQEMDGINRGPVKSSQPRLDEESQSLH